MIQSPKKLSPANLLWKIRSLKRIRSRGLFKGRFVDKRQIKAGVNFVEFILHGKHFLQGIGKLFTQLDRKGLAADVAQHGFTVFQTNDIRIELIPAITVQRDARILRKLGLSGFFWHTRDYSIGFRVFKGRVFDPPPLFSQVLLMRSLHLPCLNPS